MRTFYLASKFQMMNDKGKTLSSTHSFVKRSVPARLLTREVSFCGVYPLANKLFVKMGQVGLEPTTYGL